MKITLISFLFGMALLCAPAKAQTTLSAGDIAFVCYVSNGSPDSVSFVVLKKSGIEAGTVIHFTDNGWIPMQYGGPAYRTGEGVTSWTANRKVIYGEVVQLWLGSTAVLGASTGTCKNVFSSISMSTSGDQLFAFQGGTWPNPGKLIAGLHFNRLAITQDAAWDSSATNTNSSGFPRTASGAKSNELLEAKAGLWVRDFAASATTRARAAYWVGVDSSDYYSEDPYTMLLNINNPKNWRGFINSSSAVRTWPLVSTIAKPALKVSVAVRNVACNGGNTGYAQVYPTGGSGNYTYSWSPVSGTHPMIDFLSAGTYTCLITDDYGATISAQAVVTQGSALSIEVLSVKPSCNGLPNGEIEVKANGGTGDYQFQWTPGNLSGKKQSSLKSGEYRLIVSDQNNCIQQKFFMVKAGEVPGINLSPFPGLCAGQSHTLTEATPVGGIYSGPGVNNGVFKSDSNGTFAISYTATSVDGCTSVASQNITVKSPPPIELLEPEPICIAAESFNLKLCDNDSGVYSGTGVSDNRFFPALAGSGRHQIQYQLSYLNGCKSTGTTEIEVLEQHQPEIKNQGDSVLCSDESTVLKANQLVRWFRDSVFTGVEDTLLSTELGGTYSARLIDSSCALPSNTLIVVANESPKPQIEFEGRGSLCADSSLLIFTQPGAQYSWFKDSVPLLNETSHLLRIDTSGSYFVSVEDSLGCKGTSAPVFFKEGDRLALHCNGPTSFCQGDSVLLSCSPATSFSWFNNGIAQNVASGKFWAKANGDFLVYATDSEGCQGQASISITVYPKPNPAIDVVGKDAFCQGGVCKLTLHNLKSYQWYKDGVRIPGASYSSYVNREAGNFYAKVIDFKGCKGVSQNKEIRVHKKPDVRLSVVPFIGLNNGDSAAVEVPDAPDTQWQWYYNDSVTVFATSNAIHVRNPGRYWVRATSGAQCQSTSYKVLVYVYGTHQLRTTGTEDLSVLNVELFPIPTDGPLYLNTPSKGMVEVLGVNGEVLHRQQLNSGMNLIQLEQLSAGRYLIRVFDELGRAAIRSVEIL